MSDELNERMTRLEAKVESLAAMESKVDRLYNEWARYRGFMGGVVFVVTAVSAFFGSLFRSYLMGHWK